ncbi:MAG: threonine ammonia-lyase, biosynthetic [Fimbriimonadales bacterium]|nr:threonine ammonia-lyase, biosynthetic [Fimbriimonadales bacterium]
MLQSYLRRILLAKVYDVAAETPCELAPVLSRRLGCEVWLKREDQQCVFSFKLRGAYNKMALLPDEALAKGVVAASAGNHAQGVALAARRLGASATIVMPATTPRIKVDAVRRHGAEVVLYGDNYDAAYEKARGLAESGGMTFIHPYDDPDVIAGQGTIGLEMIRQIPQPLDAVFVPVGGGGLIAGVGVCYRLLHPETRVVGVEPEDADAMARSLRAKRRVRLERVGRFADGVAVRQVGEETFRLARQVVDEVVVVSNDEICAAIKDLFEDRRCVLEPAGALAYAGLKRCVQRRSSRGGRFAAIASGANINFDSLRHVSERAEIGERRETVFAATIPERPGSFREFCETIGPHEITEFNYRYNPGPDAHIYVGLRTANPTEVATLFAKLRQKGYQVIDLTDDEVAKLHVRHMVGGRARAKHERLFAFVFPERPGALLEFLRRLEHPWNISLFHYRNHGSDYGRVLAGIQVPPSDRGKLRAFLRDSGLEWTEETNNPACRLFL